MKTKKWSLPCSKKKNDKKMVSENPEKCGPEKNEKKKTVFPCFLTLSLFGTQFWGGGFFAAVTVDIILPTW